jgi:hypothetical protein
VLTRNCFKIKIQTNQGRNYESPAEEAKRFEIFKTNVKSIDEHNVKFEKGEETFKKGINRFADMEAGEYFVRGHAAP